ncbi:MAG: HEAT repeat domain-containing protein [Woeseia sp.]
MNCQEINYLLDANSPEELSIGEKQAVDRHFASCRACREAWAAYREVSALQIPLPPHDWHSRITAALAPTEVHAMRQSLIVGGVLAVGAAVAVAAAVAFRVGDGASRLAQRLEEPPPVAAPVSPARQEPAAVSANRVENAASAESPSQPSDSTSRGTEYTLDPNSIVVLPVPNREFDPRQETLFIQLYEELLRQLQAVPGLNVVRRELVDPFVDSGTPEEEIARELGAAHLVVLSTTLDEAVMLIITLVDATTGAQIGSTGFAPPLGARWPAELPSDVARVVDFIRGMWTPFTPAERQAAIAEARAIVLNAALRPAERVEALGKLPQTPEARTDAVVAAAVELATIAPELRVYIWRAMYGVDNPYLIEPLLNSLAYDAADHRRRAAADALGTFIAEPRVKAALEQAQASDASQAVREAAQRALSTDEEREQLALQTLLDETLPAQERLLATMLITGRHVKEVSLTDEAARAVFDIGERSSDPDIRAMAWGKLGRSRVDDPSFTGVLLDDLANHSSDSVRQMAANALKQYTDDSSVRAALGQAESDPSFEVRHAARRALGKVPN